MVYTCHAANTSQRCMLEKQCQDNAFCGGALQRHGRRKATQTIVQHATFITPPSFLCFVEHKAGCLGFSLSMRAFLNPKPATPTPPLLQKWGGLLTCAPELWVRLWAPELLIEGAGTGRAVPAVPLAPLLLSAAMAPP